MSQVPKWCSYILPISSQVTTDHRRVSKGFKKLWLEAGEARSLSLELPLVQLNIFCPQQQYMATQARRLHCPPGQFLPGYSPGGQFFHFGRNMKAGTVGL